LRQITEHRGGPAILGRNARREKRTVCDSARSNHRLACVTIGDAIGFAANAAYGRRRIRVDYRGARIRRSDGVVRRILSSAASFDAYIISVI